MLLTWASQVALVVKNLLANTRDARDICILSLGQDNEHGFHRWVKKIPWRRKWQLSAVATVCSILAWKIPWIQPAKTMAMELGL